MRPALLFIALAATLAGVGCGAEIGDSCVVETDCAQDGSRICDLSSSGGYCTIMGCDYNTCPSEAECVSFFTGSFANLTCNPATEDCVPKSNCNDPLNTSCVNGTCPTGMTPTNDCNAEELCSLDGHCVTRASEVRYCMRKCSSNGDCRDGYECRSLDLMKMHGGQPVENPDQPLPDNPQPFCAEAPGGSTTLGPVDASM